MTILAFIFDLDGVLIDSDRYHCRALQQSLAPLGIAVTEADYVARCAGNNSRHNLALFLAEARVEADLDDMVERKRALYYKLIDREAVPAEGALDAVGILKEKKYRLGVASSSHGAGVSKVLSRLDLEAAFETVVDAERVRNLKPSPDSYLMAAEQLGVQPNQCIAIEDSPPGLQAAVAAGLMVAMVRNDYNRGHTFSEADWVLDSLLGLNSRFLSQEVECIP